MPAREGYVTADDGVRLYFETWGSGAQAVIIPNGLYLADDFKHLAAARTLIYYDLRNRGRSDSVSDPSKLERGIYNDVDDLEIIRRHFGISRVDLLGHSYAGLMVVLYAMTHPDRVHRVVQIGAPPPNAATQYPEYLMNADATLAEVLSQLAKLQEDKQPGDAQERCRKFWSVLRLLYVANPDDAGKINWGRCDLPNERNFMKYWIGTILPSMRRLNLMSEEFARVKAPVLAIHGTKDRSSAYGGGREWAMKLPDARLVTIENAAHAPWIEAPEKVFSSIHTFFNGAWPEDAETVTSLDPGGKLR